MYASSPLEQSSSMHPVVSSRGAQKRLFTSVTQTELHPAPARNTFFFPPKPSGLGLHHPQPASQAPLVPLTNDPAQLDYKGNGAPGPVGRSGATDVLLLEFHPIHTNSTQSHINSFAHSSQYQHQSTAFPLSLSSFRSFIYHPVHRTKRLVTIIALLSLPRTCSLHTPTSHLGSFLTPSTPHTLCPAGCPSLVSLSGRLPSPSPPRP